MIVGWWTLSFGQQFRPDIPQAWDDKEVATFELPLVARDRSPSHLSAKEYFSLKVRPIFRSYPVYAPGREPAGYRESLLRKEPEIIFDPSKLRTKEDWIHAAKSFSNGKRYFVPHRLNPVSIRFYQSPKKESFLRSAQVVNTLSARKAFSRWV